MWASTIPLFRGVCSRKVESNASFSGSSWGMPMRSAQTVTSGSVSRYRASRSSSMSGSDAVMVSPIDLSLLKSVSNWMFRAFAPWWVLSVIVRMELSQSRALTSRTNSQAPTPSRIRERNAAARWSLLNRLFIHPPHELCQVLACEQFF